MRNLHRPMESTEPAVIYSHTGLFDLQWSITSNARVFKDLKIAQRDVVGVVEVELICSRRRKKDLHS